MLTGAILLEKLGPFVCYRGLLPGVASACLKHTKDLRGNKKEEGIVRLHKASPEQTTYDLFSSAAADFTDASR